VQALEIIAGNGLLEPADAGLRHEDLPQAQGLLARVRPVGVDEQVGLGAGSGGRVGEARARAPAGAITIVVESQLSVPSLSGVSVGIENARACNSSIASSALLAGATRSGAALVSVA